MNKWAQTGFTILESLIFIAIAGGLITSTIVILYGRQRTIEFNQSVRHFELDINDLINDIATGNFPIVEDVACYQAITGHFYFEEDIDSIPGRHKDCILLGKLIQFGTSTDTPPEADRNYGVHTLIGSADLNQGSYTGSSYIATLFNDDPPPSPQFDAFEEIMLDNGSAIADAYYIDSSNMINYVSGVILAYAEFGERFSTGGQFFGDFQSGASRISVFAVVTDDISPVPPLLGVRPTSATSARRNQVDFRNFITGDPLDSSYPAKDKLVETESNIVVCLVSLVTNEKAALEIGTEQGALRSKANFDIESTECVYND